MSAASECTQATRRRHPTCLPARLYLLAALCMIAVCGSVEAGEETWESKAHNVRLQIVRDGSSQWTWLAAKPEWQAAGIVRGAQRTLAKLKDGTTPSGEGGLLYLRVRPIEAEATLAAVAQRKAARDVFLQRFGGTGKKIETEAATVTSDTNEKGHPAVLMRAEGEAPNLRGRKARCVGFMVLTVHAARLYILTVYAFPTKFDAEGLELDQYELEASALALLDTKPAVSPKAGNGGGAREPEPRREPEVLAQPSQGWRISIDGRLARQVPTPQENADGLVLKILERDPRGSASVHLYAPLTVQYVDGVRAAPPDVAKWMTTTWWQQFTLAHPRGDVFTYAWPRKPEGSNPTFLLLPDLSNPDSRQLVVAGESKRPLVVDERDALRKLRFVERPRNARLGKRGRAREAIRGILEGNRPMRGRETILRYAWQDSKRTYRLFVVFSGDGYRRWGSAVRRTIETFEIGVPNRR